MNKKLLSSLPVPILGIESDAALLRAESIAYIITSHEFVMPDSEILMVCMYKREEINQGVKDPLHITYLSHDNDISRTRENGAYRWREAHIMNLLGFYCYSKQVLSTVCLTADDEARIRSFVGISKDNENVSEHPLQCIYRYQSVIRKTRTAARHDRIRLQIDAAMRVIRPLPDGFERWVERVAFQHSRYIYYKRSGKNINGYCTVCRRNVELKTAKHNDYGHCPLCHMKVQYKAQGMATRIADRTKFIYTQRGEGTTVIIRVYKGLKEYRDHYREPKMEYREVRRYFLSGTDSTPYFYGNFMHAGELRWCFGLDPSSTGMGYYRDDDCGYLYTRNLTGVLKGTPYQYSQIERYARHAGMFEADQYLLTYVRHPALEYLIRLGFYRIADEYLWHGRCHGLNIDGKNVRDVLGVEKDELPIIKALDATLDEFEYIRYARQRWGVPSLAVMDWIRQNNAVEDMRTGIVFARPEKIIRYIDEQKGIISAHNTLNDWVDHISNCKVLKLSLPDALFPREFRKTHDETAKLAEEYLIANEDAVITEMAEDLARQYAYSHKGLLIRPPLTRAEFIAEGKALHHCVGAMYARKVAKHESVILFIRREDNPDKPFFTLEYADNKVRQCRGLQNCGMTSEVKSFIAHWERNLSVEWNIRSA